MFTDTIKTVIVEVNHNKDNVEIVNWHYLDDATLKQKERQAEREDGQLLILPSEHSEEVDALSDPTKGLLSDGKDTNNQPKQRANTKEEVSIGTENRRKAEPEVPQEEPSAAETEPQQPSNAGTADEDGRVMVEFSEPVGGRRVKMLTPDEINGMLYKEETPESPANAEEAMAEETELPTAGQEESGESALERIPKDAQTGEPQYTQTDADTAWDAIVEQTEGDKGMARYVAESMMKAKEEALKKLESSEPKAGATVTETIAAAKEHKAAIAAARQELEQWKAIAGVENRRKAEVEAKVKAAEEEAKVKAAEEEAKARAKAEAEEEEAKARAKAEEEEKTDESAERYPVGLDEEESSALMERMEAEAAEIPLIELNPANWVKEFGEKGIVSTPIGEVKMGENQIAKLFEKGRSNQFGMIRPTLETPQLIIEVPSFAADGNSERGSSLLFVKTFTDSKGRKIYYFKSVTVKKDGLEVSVSSHYDRPKRIKEALKKGKLLYRFDGGAQTEQRPADVSVATSQEVSQGTSLAGKVSESRETKQEKAENSISARVKEASADVNTEPTEAQKEAGNYKKGHVRVGAFDITIEQPEGSVRRGTDENGKQWESKMHNTYGYFRGTEGVDGDHIDVFLSNDMDGWNGETVFVVDQYNPDGTFDEHKVMLGFNAASDAKSNYLANYEKGWEKGRRIDVSAVSLEDFEKWMASSHRKTKPFSEYKSVKPADAGETFKGHKVENSGKDIEAQIKHLEEIKDYPGADKKIVQSEIDRLKAKEEAKAKSKSEEENGVNDAKIEAVSEALSKGDEKAEELVRGLTNRELSKLRSKVKASPLLENEWLHRVRTRGDVSLHDWMLENQYAEPVKRVSGTFRITDYTAPKDSPYAERLGGVYHDKSGFAVATDGRILVASKDDFDPKLKGKVAGKDGTVSESKFPDWQKVIPAAKETKSSCIDVEDLHRFVAGVLRANKRAYISLRFPDGTVEVFKANRLNLMLRAMKQLGTSELLYTKDGMKLVAKSEKGTALLMGLVSVEDELVEANGYAYPGNTVSYQRGEVVSEMSQEERVLRDAVIDRLRESGMEVITDEEAGQRVLDEANGKVRQMSFGEPYDYAAYPYGRVEPNLAEKEVKVVKAEAEHGFSNYKEAKAWAKQNVSKSYDSEETGGKGEVRISNAAIDKFLSQSAVDKSDSKDVYLAVLKVLPGLLKTSIDVETHPDFIKGEDGKRNAKNGINKDVLVHRCYGAVSLDGKLYRVKITLKENAKTKETTNTHSYEATKIELLAGQHGGVTMTPPRYSNNSISAAKLLENVGMSYNPGEKVLTASEKRSANIREQRVYHGSGADFDRFDHSHIGEGEGNQAFGWGTYVTEVEDIGRTYADTAFSNAERRRERRDEAPIGEAVNSIIWSEIYDSTAKNFDQRKAVGIESIERIIPAFEKRLSEEKDSRTVQYLRESVARQKATLKALRMLTEERYNEERMKQGRMRHLYTVEIPDDTGENYLSWNEPLSIELVDKVAEALPSLNEFDIRRLKKNGTGENLYRTVSMKIAKEDEFNDDEKASKFLSSLGFVGIKYPTDFMRGGREDGKKNYVIFNEKDAKITDRVRFFRTAKGEAYGFTVGGKIYIDPKIANTETPIHEYAHLWAAALRGQNPKEWRNIVELMKGTSVWDEVKKRYPELKTDDEIADEVLAMYSGRRGSERLREEQRRIAEGDGGVFEKAEAISALERVKQALKKFWKSVADFLHIHYKSAEEVADRVMKDLLDGVEPNKAAREADFRDFAEKYGVDENLIKDYADAMERGDVFAANRGIRDIRRSLRIKNTGKSFREFARDVYHPVRKELYARFGNADELTKQYEEQTRRERLALESARKRAEEEQRKRKEREAELEQMSDGERDRRYMEALAKGNETVARELLSAAARSKGYADIKSDYQGVGAWAAPSNPGFETDEERRASIDEDGGEANVEDIALGHSPVEEVMFYHPERVGFGDATGIDAGHVISRAIDAVKRGGKNVKIKVYRAVPNAIKEGRLRNGDWVTPSKKYAQMHGENRLEGNYRIIEDEVPASQLWFDGNDVREWGFDDGKSYRYKNVKNNRKSDDLVTRDDNGNIIPPSKRFNSRNDDPRFMFAGEKGAARADREEEALTRQNNLDVAQKMEAAKKDAKAIKLATGWERGADGKWRYEIPDGIYHPKGDAELKKALAKQPWGKELNGLSDRILDGEGLSKEETERFNELAEKEAAFKADYLKKEKPHLADWLENDELFKAYPELKRVGIVFTDNMPKEQSGYYDSKSNTITVNTNSSEDAASIIAHEVQHAIQRYEGFATGGNLKAAMRYLSGNKRADVKIKQQLAYKLSREKGLGLSEGEVNSLIGHLEYEDISDDELQKQIDALCQKHNITEDQLEDIYPMDSVWYEAYNRISGETEARNVQKRMSMTAEERRASLAADTEDVARDSQILLFDDTGKNMSLESPKEDDINAKFNIRLAELVKNPDQKDKVLHLGRSSKFLTDGGLADAEIILEFDKLAHKSKEGYKHEHPFDISDIKDLPKTISSPIAVFDNTNDKNDGRVILTELKKDGRNFIVAVKISTQNRRGGIVLEVNQITTLFPKDAKGIVYWFNSGKATNIDKEKALRFIEALPNHPGTTIKEEELFSAAKVVENFENSKFKSENDALFRVGDSKELRDGRQISFVRMPTTTFNALWRHLRAEGIKPDAHKARTGSMYMRFERNGVLWEVRCSNHTKPEYYGEAQKPVELTYYKDKQGEENLSVSVDLGTSGYNIEDMKALMAEIDRLKNDTGEVKESFDRGVASDEVMERYPLLSQVLEVKSENEVRAGEQARKRWEQAEKVRKQEMRDGIEDMAKKLHLDNVDIVDKEAKFEATRRERAKGIFERSTGRITINIGNCKDKEDAAATLLHEAVAHHGLRKLFGENFDTFLDNVYESGNSEIRRIIDKRAKRYKGDKRTATEEYMASLAERTDFENAKKSGWWQKIKDFFLAMLEKIGLKSFKGKELSNNELRYILWRSYENLKTGGKDTVFSAADDLSKQSELKVGEFAQEANKDESIEAVNSRFNQELQQQIDGNLPSNHVYQMGNPGKILLSTGVPDLPIQMKAKRLQDKATLFDHNFDLNEVKDLVKALQEPMAVFAYGDKTKAQNIIIPLQKDGKNFIVGLSLNPTVEGRSLEINSIRNVFPKDNSEWLNWINQGKALYLDKEKVQNLINQQRTNLADVEYLDLDSAAKVVENFENPKPESENDALFRDGDDKDYEKAQARDRYERRVRSGLFQSREALQDSMLSLKVAMDEIERATTGKPKRIEDYADYENAYLGENRLSSVNPREVAAFTQLHIVPMLKEANRLAPTAKERAKLIDYMFAKHGLERNGYMRQREAEKEYEAYKKKHPETSKTVADFLNANRDYAGLTALTGKDDVLAAEAEAQRMVAEYEKGHDTTELWRLVNATNKATNYSKWNDEVGNKEKGLAYLSFASQPVQQVIDKQVLSSAAKVVENFENPKPESENDVLFRDGDAKEHDTTKLWNGRFVGNKKISYIKVCFSEE